ncbi:MAG: DUF1929 domain-containing protein [Pseudonocardia sp.]|nr:DUF1929 domain-containing protein [Pseudonocardia sp.]
MSATRGYHSTALLMPDGTVLVGGSGHANPGLAGQDSAQIYSPPYLSKGPRPTITSAPASATYGATIPVSTPDAASISAVNLVSLGADTHQSDMDQHFVPLTFTQGTGGINVQIPSAAATAPPGNYMLFILNSSGVPSMASFITLAPTLSAPATPTNVSATAGNASATVSWTAPDDGNSPITSYTVTPWVNGTAQTPVTVSGGPPVPTTTTVTGLTNGTQYTFTVTATNTIGTSQQSAPSNAVTPSAAPPPAYVQGTSAHSGSTSALTLTPSSAITIGNRLIVGVGIWSSGNATAKSVTDSAGNTYVELVHYTASDGTEESVWTAPITHGGATKPTITVTPTAKADVGAVALEYSGLSSVADATVVDQMSHATGTTKAAGSVASGATPATTVNNELALGLYVDSGFGDTLAAGSGFAARVNVSSTSDMELLAEDQAQATAGASPNASVSTGANTIWLMSTLVLKGAAGTPGGAAPARQASASLPSAPSPVRSSLLASLGTSPLIGTTPVAPYTPARAVGHRGSSASGSARAVVRCGSRARTHRRAQACASVRRAAMITAAARARFIFEALLKGLSSSLFCYHGPAARNAGGWTAWFKPARAT